MADAQASFTLNFNADFSSIDDSTASLEKMRSQLLGGEKAIQGLQKSIAALKGTSEVVRFQKIAGDIRSADGEIAKLQKRYEGMREAVDNMSRRDKGFGAALGGLNAAKQQLDEAKEKVAALRGEMAKLETTNQVRQFKELSKAEADTRDKMGQLQSKYAGLGGDMQKQEEHILAGGGGLRGLAERMVEARLQGESLGGKLRESLGPNLKAAIIVGAVAGVALLTAAVATLYLAANIAMVRLAMFAVTQSDAARSGQLLREAATGSAHGADQMSIAIDRVRMKTSATSDELQKLALNLRRYGFEGQEALRAMNAITVVEKTMGAEAASQLKGLIEAGKATRLFKATKNDLLGTGITQKDIATALAARTKVGVNSAVEMLRDGRVKMVDAVAALSEAVDKKLGGIAEKQMLALPVQFERFKENIGGLFDGLDTEEFLVGLKDVLQIFDTSTTAGKELKETLTAIFQPMLNNATKALPEVKRLLLRTIGDIGYGFAAFVESGGFGRLFTDGKQTAQELYETVKNIASALETMGKGLSLLNKVTSSTSSLEASGHVIKALTNDGQSGTAKDGAGVGRNAAAGIALGLKEGTPGAVEAMKFLSDATMGAFKKDWLIQSPSRVARDEARWIPLGAAQGIEDETPTVERAIADMGSPDAMGARGSVEAKGARMTSRGGMVVIEQLVIEAGANVDDSEDIAQKLINAIERRVAAQGR